jgi:hypothetical protein
VWKNLIWELNDDDVLEVLMISFLRLLLGKEFVLVFPFASVGQSKSEAQTRSRKGQWNFRVLCAPPKSPSINVHNISLISFGRSLSLSHSCLRGKRKELNLTHCPLFA